VFQSSSSCCCNFFFFFIFLILLRLETGWFAFSADLFFSREWTLEKNFIDGGAAVETNGNCS
jgi:hypothetical protein